MHDDYWRWYGQNFESRYADIPRSLSWRLGKSEIVSEMWDTVGDKRDFVYKTLSETLLELLKLCDTIKPNNKKRVMECDVFSETGKESYCWYYAAIYSACRFRVDAKLRANGIKPYENLLEEYLEVALKLFGDEFIKSVADELASRNAVVYYSIMDARRKTKGNIIKRKINAMKRFFEEMAKIGYPSAMVELGDLLMHHFENPQKAIGWYEKAYRMGSADGAFRYAKAQKNEADSRKIFECLSAMDYKYAHYYVGKSWRNGKYMVSDCQSDSASNMSRAGMYWRKGMEAGDPECYSAMAHELALGYVTTKDLSKAVELYKKSIDLGYPLGYYYIANCMRANLGVFDFGEMILWYMRAIINDVPDANDCMVFAISGRDEAGISDAIKYGAARAAIESWNPFDLPVVYDSDIYEFISMKIAENMAIDDSAETLCCIISEAFKAAPLGMTKLDYGYFLNAAEKIVFLLNAALSFRKTKAQLYQAVSSYLFDAEDWERGVRYSAPEYINYYYDEINKMKDDEEIFGYDFILK